MWLVYEEQDNKHIMKSWEELHLGEEALGGLSAGIIGTIIGYPLDLVKTRMQTTSTGSKNIFGVGKQIVKKEGIGALYKGVVSELENWKGKRDNRILDESET